MPEVTVKSLADTVEVSVARLLQEMQEAGLPHNDEADLVSEEQKRQLLVHLRESKVRVRRNPRGRPAGLEQVLAARRAEIAQKKGDPKTGNPAARRAFGKEEVEKADGENPRGRLAGLEQVLAARHEEIAQRAGDLEKSDLPRTEEDTKNAKLAIKEKERQIEDADALLSSLRQQKSRTDAAEAELNASRGRLEEAEGRLAETQKEIAEAQKELAELDAHASNIDELSGVREQIADVNGKIEAAELDRSRLTAKRDALVAKEEEFQESCRLLEQARRDLKGILSETEDAQAQIGALPEADYALRVNDTGQAFHQAVQTFLQSEKHACLVLQRIQNVLRDHHLDNDQILDALKCIGESNADDLAATIRLSTEVADGLGDFDRRLKAMTEKLDSPN